MSERKYRPSNGTEGEGFICAFCANCERDRGFWDGTGEGCGIVARTLIYDVDNPEYPGEWTYTEGGEPTCTAFVQLGSRVPTDSELEAQGQHALFAPEATP